MRSFRSLCSLVVLLVVFVSVQGHAFEYSNLEMVAGYNTSGLTEDGQKVFGHDPSTSSIWTWNTETGYEILVEGNVDKVYELTNDGLAAGTAVFDTLIIAEGDTIFNARVPALFADGEIITLMLAETNRTTSSFGHAYDISADGSTVVGQTPNDDEMQVAFCWTEEDGIIQLPFPETFLNTKAISVNSEGTVILGEVQDDTWRRKTVQWQLDANGGWEMIEMAMMNPDLDHYVCQSSNEWGRWISSAGDYAVGYMFDMMSWTLPNIGFRWAEGVDTLTNLENAPWQPLSTGPLPTSVDDMGRVYGQIMYGDWFNTYYNAFLWTETEGMINVVDSVLVPGGFELLPDFTGSRVKDVNPSGRRILVNFENPMTFEQAYSLVVFPVPQVDMVNLEITGPETININWQNVNLPSPTFSLQFRYQHPDNEYWTEYMSVEEDLLELSFDFMAEDEGSYQFRLAVVDGLDMSEWVESEVVEIVPAPEMPGEFSGVFDFENLVISLSWLDNAEDETAYTLDKRSMEAGGDWGEWATIATLDADIIAYDDEDLTIGTNVMYRLRAEGLRIPSEWVESESFLVEVLPATPGDFNAEFILEDTHVSLSWSDLADNENIYRIERRVENINGGWSDFSLLVELDADVTSFEDVNVTWESNYSYRLRAENSIGFSDWVESGDLVSDLEGSLVELPRETKLNNTYPNPFNSIMTIAYDLHETADVKIQLYSITGQLVNTIHSGQQNAGNFRKSVNLNQMATGTYFLRFTAGSYSSVKKVMLVK